MVPAWPFSTHNASTVSSWLPTKLVDVDRVAQSEQKKAWQVLKEKTRHELGAISSSSSVERTWLTMTLQSALAGRGF